MFAWLRDQPEALVAWVESVVEHEGSYGEISPWTDPARRPPS